MTRPNFYASLTIDRAHHARRDPAWVADHLTRPESRLLLHWSDKHLVAGGKDDPSPIWLAPEQEDWWRAHVVAHPVFLGLVRDVAHFSVDISALEEPEEHDDVNRHGRFRDLRSMGPLLSHAEGGLLAMARGLHHWHRKNRFCGVCGLPTVWREGGHVITCSNPDCGNTMFPRMDPAVIVLIHDGDDRCLLGRNARFPTGMHSTLAGFVEAGESLEDTVRREMHEESGLVVDDIIYRSSQPWPFPQSLMLGFWARAVGGELTPDPEELEDVNWYTRDFLANVGDGDDFFRLPRQDSIARRLIEDWVALTA